MIFEQINTTELFLLIPYFHFEGDDGAFSHHFQRSIDFNTVNTNRNLGMDFLINSLATGMILNDMIHRHHIFQYTPCSLGSVLGNITQGTRFRDTLPKANIRHTSLR